MRKENKKRRSNKATPIRRGGDNEDDMMCFAGLGADEVNKDPEVVEKLQVSGVDEEGGGWV